MTVDSVDTIVDPALLARVRECQGKLCVHRNGRLPKHRKFSIIPGFTPPHNLGVYSNCVSTVERAFVERYFLCKSSTGFRPALRVSKSQFTHPLHWFGMFKDHVLKTMPHLAIMDEDEVIAAMPSTKRKVYEQAKDSYVTQGPLTSSDAKLSAFVKFEKQDISKAPRVINPRSARYNLTLARFLKHYEHHCFKAINRAFRELSGGKSQSRATVIKGFDADTSAEILREKWDRFVDPVAIGADATKFDMHVSLEALAYEHTFYNDFWRNPLLRKILRWQLRNKGTARCVDGKVDFEMRGTRCSGDINTSLGNCILMCAMIWTFCVEHDIDCELINNGDDCVIIVERSLCDFVMRQLPIWLRKCGFEVVMEAPVDVFEKIVFCQTQPVHLSTGWRMVRDPFTCFRKDTMCLRSMPNAECFKKWMYAVGAAGATLCAGVPVLSSFYAMFKRNGLKSDKFRNLISPYRFGMKASRTAILDSRARASFWAAFDVLPCAQQLLERHFRQLVVLTLDVATIVPRDCLHFELPGAQLLNHDLYT